MKTNTKIFGGIAIAVTTIFLFSATQHLVGNRQAASVVISQQQSQELEVLVQRVAALQATINFLMESQGTMTMDMVLPHLLSFFYSTLSGEQFSFPPTKVSPATKSSSGLPPSVTIENLPDGSQKITICQGDPPQCIVIIINPDGSVTVTFPPIPDLTTIPITLKITCDSTGQCRITYNGVTICTGTKAPGGGLFKFKCAIIIPGPDNDLNFYFDIYTDEQGRLCYKIRNNPGGPDSIHCVDPNQFPQELYPFFTPLFPGLINPAAEPVASMLKLPTPNTTTSESVTAPTHTTR